MRTWRNWQTRWFQVPVKQFMWVQVPSSAPYKLHPCFAGVFLYEDNGTVFRQAFRLLTKNSSQEFSLRSTSSAPYKLHPCFAGVFLYEDIPDRGNGYRIDYGCRLGPDGSQSCGECRGSHYYASCRRNATCICASCDHADRLVLTVKAPIAFRFYGGAIGAFDVILL